eukprot:428959_1
MFLQQHIILFTVILTVLSKVPNWKWKGWDNFPSLHFACNTSGPENTTQLQQDALYQMVIYEFRHERDDGTWTNEESVLQQQCSALKHLSPETPCLVYRSGCWAGSMFKLGQEAINIGTGNNWFLFNNASANWGADFNWSNKDASSFFINNITVEIAQEQNVDGVFLDDMETDACGLRNNGFAMTEYQKQLQFNESLKVYIDSFTILNNGNKLPLFSTWDAFSSIPWADFQAPPTAKCPYPEDKIYDALSIRNTDIMWSRYYEFFLWAIGPSQYVDNPNNNNQCQAYLLNIIEESKRNISIIARTPYCPNSGGICGNGQIQQGSFLEAGNNTQYNILVLYDALTLQANDLGTNIISTLIQSNDIYTYFYFEQIDNKYYYIRCKVDNKYWTINQSQDGILMSFDK